VPRFRPESRFDARSSTPSSPCCRAIPRQRQLRNAGHDHRLEGAAWLRRTRERRCESPRDPSRKLRDPALSSSCASTISRGLSRHGSNGRPDGSHSGIRYCRLHGSRGSIAAATAGRDRGWAVRIRDWRDGRTMTTASSQVPRPSQAPTWSSISQHRKSRHAMTPGADAAVLQGVTSHAADARQLKVSPEEASARAASSAYRTPTQTVFGEGRWAIRMLVGERRATRIVEGGHPLVGHAGRCSTALPRRASSKRVPPSHPRGSTSRTRAARKKRLHSGQPL